MQKKQETRTKWLTLRMTESEYAEIEKLTAQTTCHFMSDYARKLVLGKPVVMRYRNQSLDDFLNEMLQLRNALNSIGNNFNQSVRRLHTFRHVPDIQQWIVLNEQDKARIFREIETISSTINKAYQQWLRE